MTDIDVRPAHHFDLSLSDRSHPGGPWLHSFLGTIKFTGDHEVEEDDVPIVFIILALIETSVLIRDFGCKPKVIPIPSTDHELIIEKDRNIFLSCLKVGEDRLALNIPLNEQDIRNLFDKIVNLMEHWRPTRRDDQYFIRSNWLLGAALDIAQERAR